MTKPKDVTSDGQESPKSPEKIKPEETPAVTRKTTREVLSDASANTHDLSGFILGVLVWAWIGLPFIKDGPSGVKNVLRAKFLNKDPKGAKLP